MRVELRRQQKTQNTTRPFNFKLYHSRKFRALRLKSPIHFFIIHSSLSDAKLVKNINFKHRTYEKSFFFR